MTVEHPTAIPIPEGSWIAATRGRQSSERVSAPHRHSQGQLLGSSKGLLTVGSDVGVWTMPSIHAVWIPPHHIHWARSHGPMDGWTVYIAEEMCKGLPPQPCTIQTSGLLREAILRATTWSAGPQKEADFRVSGVILDEISGLPAEAFGLPLPRAPRLVRVAQAIIDDPADERGMIAWAACSAISERTLSRRFVSETGFTFREWRQRARLLRSLELLAEGRPINAIALDLGYATASAFIALFRNVFNETPATYRSHVIGDASE